MITIALQEIGLTHGEIKVYLSLLELGSTATGKITQKSGISGSKVYEVLDRLIKKGLASSVIKNGTKQFEATNPSKIMQYLVEKEEEIKRQKDAVTNIIPLLKAKQELAQSSEVKVFTGFEGLKTANEDIITTLKAGEEWLSMGLTEQPKTWEQYFTKQQYYRAKKKIRHKHLLNEKYKKLYKQRKRLAYTEFRFLPKQFEMPTSVEIYANKVIVMILEPENPLAIMIENKAVADSFKKYFYAFWKTAKKAC